MAMRRAYAEWDWLASQRTTQSGRSLVITGDANHTGLLFAFGGTAFATLDWSEPSRVVPVGSPVVLTVTLTYPDVSADPPVLGELAPAGATGVVDIVGTTPSDGILASATYRCLAPGDAQVTVSYPVTNIGADIVFFNQLGLGATSTEITTKATITCTDEPIPTDSPGPSDSPAPSLPSL
jgi:hypothetical protein